jgi:hypothetical protein
MTSSSRRKPRTTRPSTASRRSDPRSLLLAALLWGLLPAGVEARDWRAFARSAPESADPRLDPAFPPAEPVTLLPAAAGAATPLAAAVVGAEEPDVVPADAPADVGPATSGVLVVAADRPAESARTADACREDAAECREALQRLRADAISGIDLDIRVAGRPGNDYPCECRLEGETFRPRNFATTMFTWKAAGYCHKPLYFEDWQLERYGHSHGALDPIFSAAHFFVSLPVLPYKMGVELPWECVYPLGHYRPGNCAPWTIPAVPISGRGLAVQAATVTGIVFLLP